MRYLVIPLITLFLFPFSVSAKTNVDIYHAEVVLTNDKNASSIAWAKGLEQVLVKASGDINIANNTVVKKALQNSSDYLTKFKYGTLKGKKSLDMQYNPKQISGLLAQANVSFWPKERESILVWLVQDDNVDRQIGWEQSGLNSVADLNVSADQSGLPIILPLGDMDDIIKISAPDLWGNFSGPLEAASVRYPADAVLVLKLSQNGDDSEVNWRLYDSVPNHINQLKQPPLSGVESGSVSQAIDLAIKRVSLYYAKRSKPEAPQVADDALRVNFSGITSALSFFQLERMLLNLDSVATVQVNSIQANSITFNVELLTSKAEFERQVAAQKGVKQNQTWADPTFVFEQDVSDKVRAQQVN